MPHASFRQDTVRTLPYVGRGGKHQCIYWEASFECFGVRVFPSGRRTYVYSYRVRGRKRLGKIGRVDVLTLDQARKKAKACLGKVAEREDPQQEADAEKEIPTVEQLVNAYIKEYAKPKKKTWEDDQSTLTRNLLPAHRAALATTVTSAEISAIHVRIGAKHPYGANGFLDVVCRMYNWGEESPRSSFQRTTRTQSLPREMKCPSESSRTSLGWLRRQCAPSLAAYLLVTTCR